MSTVADIEWRYRETRDSEFAETTIEDLTLLAQDCDGDFAYWHVKRGDKYLAAGETRRAPGAYHFDTAQERVVMVARAILQAEDYNSIKDCEPCGGRTGNERCSKCHGFGFYKNRPSPAPKDGGAET